MDRPVRLTALFLVCLVTLSGCAIPVKQVALTSPMVPASGRSFVLAVDAQCAPTTGGYSRTLRAGTRWELFGTLDRGDVFRSPDQALTVEGFNVHEAYIVVNGNELVGFFLPVEKTFTPASKHVGLAMK